MEVMRQVEHMNCQKEIDSMKDHKWYAQYTGVGEFDLLSSKELEKYKQKCIDENRGSDINDLRNIVGFNTFKEAQEWIRQGIECDRHAAKTGLDLLYKQKAKGRN